MNYQHSFEAPRRSLKPTQDEGFIDFTSDNIDQLPPPPRSAFRGVVGMGSGHDLGRELDRLYSQYAPPEPPSSEGSGVFQRQELGGVAGEFDRLLDEIDLLDGQNRDPFSMSDEVLNAELDALFNDLDRKAAHHRGRQLAALSDEVLRQPQTEGLVSQVDGWDDLLRDLPPHPEVSSRRPSRAA